MTAADSPTVAMLSRRRFSRLALVGGTALASGSLAACTTSANGVTTYSPILLSVLGAVVSALQAVSNSIASVLTQLSTMTGINIPSATVAQIQGWLNFLSQLAAQIQAAVNGTAPPQGSDTLAQIVQKAETYINDILSAASGIASLVPGLGTALAYAAVIVPYLEMVVNYLLGVTPTPPSTTVPVPVVPPSAKPRPAARFAAPPGTTPANAINYLNSITTKP